jgi:hypothetical protein
MTHEDHSAFPKKTEGSTAGLSKREYFAGLAMQAYCSSSLMYSFEVFAKMAVQQADALIEELNKKP